VSEAASGVALGYEPPADLGERRVWISSGGSHRTELLGASHRRRLLAAVLDVRPDPGARLVLLGMEVDGLRPAGRAALRDRIGFLPPDGGLLSSLNAWENIVLPIGFHRGRRQDEVGEEVYGMLTGLGADPTVLLAKLPERMSPFEKKLTGYVRIALEKPDLVLAEDLHGGLDSRQREAADRFPAAYLERCPGGTFVRLEAASAP
jgi:ABC-type transporter Mla maintaining outer membrane lipid asymmetry ATPase subunit MlaF